MGMRFLFFVSLWLYILTQMLKLAHFLNREIKLCISRYRLAQRISIFCSRNQLSRRGQVLPVFLISGFNFWTRNNMRMHVSSTSGKMASDFLRTMIIEIKYFSTNNTVIRTGNSMITELWPKLQSKRFTEENWTDLWTQRFSNKTGICLTRIKIH